MISSWTAELGPAARRGSRFLSGSASLPCGSMRSPSAAPADATARLPPRIYALAPGIVVSLGFPPKQNALAAVQGGTPIGGIAGRPAAARAGRLTHERPGPCLLPITRSARIDFLRGVAIIVVLLHHFSLTYHLVDSPLSRILPATWVRQAVANGNYGVMIFFVISG